jgi:hypothetical protein
MALEMSQPRSRRALLAAAAGAAAATVASALDGPGLVSATEGQTVVVGDEYTGESVTKFDTAGTGAMALQGNSSYVGVYGSSSSGTGVAGVADALAGATRGVYGFSASTTGVGVHGTSAGNSTGVLGTSGPGTHAASPRTGVYGYAAQDAMAAGVRGDSTVGRGVVGVAASGIGVRAVVTTGTGVYATTGGLKSGTALRTVGRVRFDNSVGIATIAAGTSSVTVTPGIDLTATSAVVATLQGSAGGTTAVRCVTVNATADTFTIYLTATATAAVKVAWHVFG